MEKLVKKIIVALAVSLLASTSFALDDMNSSQMMTYMSESMSVVIGSQMTTEAVFGAKEAAYIANDVQDYLQTNEMSAFLQQKVNELQSIVQISKEDAIDLLLEKSLSVLAKKSSTPSCEIIAKASVAGCSYVMGNNSEIWLNCSNEAFSRDLKLSLSSKEINSDGFATYVVLAPEGSYEVIIDESGDHNNCVIKSNKKLK